MTSQGDARYRARGSNSKTRGLGLLAVAGLLWLAGTATAQALQCNICRQPLVGPYMHFEGKNLHEECYYRFYASYCDICELPIEGQFTYNSWGDSVHAEHIGEYPACEFCNRLTAPQLTGRVQHRRDGMVVCGLCAARGIDDPEPARELLDSVRMVLISYGIHVASDFDLKLVDRGEMLRISPRSGHEAWGFSGLTERHSLFGLFRTRTVEVYVLRGMPRDFMAGVMAHELMHVWLFANAPLEMDSVLVEGSCEYAAYLVLSRREGAYAKFYLERQYADSDPVYGGGFRAVTGFVHRESVGDWLDYLTRNAAPPW